MKWSLWTFQILIYNKKSTVQLLKLLKLLNEPQCLRLCHRSDYHYLSRRSTSFSPSTLILVNAFPVVDPLSCQSNSEFL